LPEALQGLLVELTSVSSVASENPAEALDASVAPLPTDEFVSKV